MLLAFDTNGFLNKVLDFPSRYGIKDTRGYCKSYDQPYVDTEPQRYGCLPLNEYVWFNDGHLTSRVHEILATELRRVFGEAVGWKERIGLEYLVDLIMVRGVS
jgi:phospholipase/lecithinase/hemolysin